MFFLHFQFSQLKDTVKQKHITISIKKNSQHSTLFSSKIDEGKKNRR